MLTPPYHFSTVFCPPIIDYSDEDEIFRQVLYRGSLPAIRNLPFLKRLGLKTILYLQKKPLGPGEPLVRWAKRHEVELVWIKAEKMGEETLGMGRHEVGEVLKTLLDTSAYPVYLADKDGISHTTLVVACLRKLQGWSPDSILDEIARFEPDHEDLPLLPFITSYLTTGSSTDTLTLPAAPYPTWLWPGMPASSMPEKGNSGSANVSRSNTVREREPSVSRERSKDIEKDKEKDKSPAGTLPFAHPPTARKHPTMKLTFPPIPPAPPTIPSPSTLSRVNSRRDTRVYTQGQQDQSLMAAATSILAAALRTLGVDDDSVEEVLGDEADKQEEKVIPSSIAVTPKKVEERVVGGKISRMVSFHEDTDYKESKSRGETTEIDTDKGETANIENDQLEEQVSATGETSPSGDSIPAEGVRSPDSVLSPPAAKGLLPPENTPFPDLTGAGNEEAYDFRGGVIPDIDEGEDEEEEEEDEEEDDDDDDDDDTAPQPPSLHISALDLAGYG